MIRYDLVCAAGHRFDSWFQSSDAFDGLAARGLVTCTICGCTDVRKALMAPRVAVAPEPAQAVAAGPAPAGVPGTAPASDPGSDPREAPARTMAAGPLSAAGSEMERMLAELRRKVEATSTYVGRDFPREARMMHLGEAPERQIHGEATPAEARSLVEDGVPVMPLPVTPKARTN